MSQTFRYPAGAPVSISAVGPNGLPAPNTSIQVGGEDPSGNLQSLKLNASDELLVSVDDLPLPAGAATEAKQDVQITEAQTANTALADILSDTSGILADTAVLAAVDFATETTLQEISADTGTLAVVDFATEATLAAASAKLPATLGQAAMAASLAVVVASDQSTLPVSVASLPLPSGAATEATLLSVLADTTALVAVDFATETSLAAMSAKLPATLGQKAMAASMAVVLASDQSAVPVSVASLPLPSGSATLAEQQAQTALLTTIDTDTGAIATSVAAIDTKTPALGQAAMAASVPVVLASDQTSIPVTIASPAPVPVVASANLPVKHDYVSTPVSSAAYVQIVASTSLEANGIEIFDSSGQALYLALGPIAGEVDQFMIYPGGNGRIPFRIDAGTRISVKAVDTTADNGFLIINLYT